MTPEQLAARHMAAWAAAIKAGYDHDTAIRMADRAIAAQVEKRNAARERMIVLNGKAKLWGEA